MTDKKKPGSSFRNTKTRVKTAKRRKTSSTRWLQRQLNDPYVAQAKKEGYRSRAAYKLIELDEKFHLFKSGYNVVDLGAAPGSWSQVVAKKIGAKGKVVGIDLLPIAPLKNAIFIEGDFTEDAPYKELLKLLNKEKVNVVLSDMAANATGHTQTDHIRIVALCELAMHFAILTLASGGAFVAKVLRGGTENTLLAEMKQHFTSVKHFKPDSSRKDSAEMYVVATGFRL